MLKVVFFLSLIFLDQIVKDFVLKLSVRGTKRFCLIKNFLDISYTENYGVAFGIFKSLNRVIITILVLLMFFAFSFYFLKNKKLLKNKNIRLFLIFITAGGVSNLLDRLTRGYVVDYIELKIFPPIFNLADVYITLGTIMLAFYVFFVLKNKHTC